MATGGALVKATRLAPKAMAALLLTVLLPIMDAAANTRACRQLEVQLTDASTGGSSSKAKRYDTAIARQQEQIEKARDQARRAGCGRALAFCGEINATLRRMEGNLAELQQTRTKLGKGGSRRERARIMAAMDANGCRQAPRKTQTDTPPRQADGGSARPATGGLSGKFRTMCVRTCDGYYFPISYAVSRSAFERDANACSAMCPGAKVELHYHRVPGEESETMVSAVTGLPYTEMKNAFLYRQTDATIPQGCGCALQARSKRGFEVIAGERQSGFVGESTPAMATTPAMPSTLEIRGSIITQTASRSQRQEVDKEQDGDVTKPEVDAGDRAVRVVGPRFLPDPEEAIDLQARDPHPAP